MICLGGATGPRQRSRGRGGAPGNSINCCCSLDEKWATIMDQLAASPFFAPLKFPTGKFEPTFWFGEEEPHYRARAAVIGDPSVALPHTFTLWTTRLLSFETQPQFILALWGLLLPPFSPCRNRTGEEGFPIMFKIDITP